MFPYDRPDRLLKHSVTSLGNPYVRGKCLETRLNCSDCLTKNAVTDTCTVLTSETIIIRKPGLTERHAITLVVGTRLKIPRCAVIHTPKILFITKCLKAIVML